MNASKNSPTILAIGLGLGVLFATGQPTLAQTPDDNRPPATMSSDSTLASAIAPYRDDVRRSVLLVSQQPQLLTQLAQQQAGSQQAFDALIQTYGQTKKGWFYDIARYPDALHALAALPPRSDKARGQAITNTLPPESQRSAWKLYRHHHDDLVRADSLNQQADQRFDSLMAPLDPPTQQALRQLLATPDLLTLLTQEIDKTTRLGQAYQTDSVRITQQLSILHDSLTVQNRRELADYQRELNEDPLAQQELQQAGQAYAQANGYNTSINPNPAWVDSSQYYQNPYSFWFGYPSWYSSPLWYPSAWWFNTGYYYGSGGNLVLFGLPSPGFANWFFRRGYRAYPHLCTRFNAYYDRNIGRHHFWARGNSGFMSAAHQRFGPVHDGWSGRTNWLTNPRRYSRSNSSSGTSWSGSGRSIWTTPTHRSYTPSRSWHSSGTRSFSSGSHSHSSGFHSGGSHGGSHSSGGFHGGGHHSSGHR